ncbi:hypothetical protein ACQ4PT_045558 [Festuca glaucescens]
MRTPSSSLEGAAEQGGAGDKLLQLFMGDQDLAAGNMFVEARIRAAFYPKFENDKSDQQTRTRMIEMVSRGLATMEVTLKHSGSLFMYAGPHGGAYAKNSYGNLYTAVGVFILGRMFHEAWGKEAPKMQAKFNAYLEEMIRLMKQIKEMKPSFFVDVNLFKANNMKTTELSEDSNILLNSIEGSLDSSSSVKDGLADEDSNLMVKLKFLPYKIRTFLLQNGLSTIFKNDRSAYSDYYVRQMKNWGTSESKLKELCKLLNEWAAYIRGKYGNKPLSSSIYLNVENFKRKYLGEAEPFLEQYAKRSPANLALIRAAGNMVQTENFLAILDVERDEEDGFQPEHVAAPSSPTAPLDVVSKIEGLIVFFPGIPGCAKSALCNEILKMPGGLGDSRPIHSLEGDLTKGTDTNPFSLEALAVFMFRVLKRVNHPGNLGENSLNAGNVLIMFYKLYDGKSRREFESELYERFGSLVKMPLLKPDRAPLPGDVKSILDKGLSLFRPQRRKRGREEPSNDAYAKEWEKWEKKLRKILFRNDDYLKSIQVPFEVAVKEVVEQLKAVVKGDIKTPDTAKRRFGNIFFAAVTLSQADILGLVRKVAEKDTAVKKILNCIKLEDKLNKVHITLAHKSAHGVAAVASYAVYKNQEVPVSFNAFFYTDKMAALEAQLGMVNGETIVSRNDWPHVTVWTAAGVGPKKANTLPHLVSEEKAKRVAIDPPITITGVIDFY